MKCVFLVVSWLSTIVVVTAQVGNLVIEGQEPPQIILENCTDEIILDGALTEATWQNAQTYASYTQYFPTDSVLACGKTEILMAYDETTLYIASRCYAPNNEFTVASLKRDYGFGGSDNISFLIDTYNDKTNAYLFGMNPYGVRREALIANGGKARNDFDPSWDNKWNGESKIYEDHYVCELAIPFSSIRYKKGVTKFRFNSYRNDVQCNEISCFVNIPREFILMDLNYMADMQLGQSLDTPPQNITLIPYLSSAITRDFDEVTEMGTQWNYNVGGDAKIAVSSSLNLDLTVNPDFSQVEVDQQVTNLDRFEIFFPERRQFFLENADLFSSFGSRTMRPFFSRRIGVSQDTVTGNNIQNTIYGGMRLSGKLNEKLRIGVLDMQTAAQKDNDLPSYNYFVGALEQRVFDRSNVGFIMVNKQAINASDFGGTSDTYDRVIGTEFRLRSKDNFWSGKTSYMQAITPNDDKMKLSHFTSLQYNRRKFRADWSHMLVGAGMDAEVGFIPRKDILLLSPAIDYRVFPATDKVAQYTFSANFDWIYKLGQDNNEIIEDFGLEENRIRFDWNTNFSNNHRMNLGVSYSNFFLLEDFDPTRVQAEDIFLDAGTKHQNTAIAFSYNSDSRKTFFYRFNPLYEKFFGGDRYSLSGSLAYRFLPYGSISIDYNFSHIDIGGNFDKANLWLVGPKFDVTFTRNLFWTTFLQYNSQLENLNINSRFQWRFAPVSDFFIVYTDNYNTETFDPVMSRNRALVAKLTYWLNL